MLPRLLFTGGSGLLAINLALLLRQHFEVISILHSRVVSINGVQATIVDLANVDEVKKKFQDLKPFAVIHAAGMTDVAECQKNPSAAFHANDFIAGNIAKACCDLGIKMVHISTDHIFDGQSEMLVETTPPAPLNVYAASKLAGEVSVAKNCKDALIVRTNFFGWGTCYRHSFSDFVFNNLRSERKIGLYSDIYFTPILIERLCVLIMQLVRACETGIYHLTGDDRVSKFVFGVQLAKIFNLNQDLIRPIQYFGEDTVLLPRPKDMSLSNNKATEFVGHRIGSVETFLLALKSQRNTGVHKEIRAI